MGFAVGIQGDSVLVTAYGDDLTFPVGRSLVDGVWHHVVVTYHASTAIAPSSPGSSPWIPTVAGSSGGAGRKPTWASPSASRATPSSSPPTGTTSPSPWAVASSTASGTTWSS